MVRIWIERRVICDTPDDALILRRATGDMTQRFQ